MTVPYSFANATVSIPLSQLDANFNTPITLGNTAIQLGNTVTTLNNMTLANVTISSGNVTITNVSVTTANVTTLNATTVIATTANVTTANITTGNVTNMTSGNVTITGGSINGTTLGATTASTANVTTLTTSSTVTINGGTANGVAYLDGSKVLTTGSALTFDGTNLKIGNPTYAPNTNLSGNLLQIKSSSGFSYLTMGNGDGVNNNTYIGSASSITTFGTVTDAGATTELMRLTSTGLGIGTSSPAQKLHVQGRTQLGTAGVSGQYALTFVPDTAGNSFVSLLNDTGRLLFIQGGNPYAGSTLMTLDQSGNLGIGTSSPAGKLHVSGQTRIADSANAANYILIGAGANAPRGGNALTAQTGSLVFATESANPMIFVTNAVEAARLDSSGNLGIGTSSPAYKLDVDSTAGTVVSLNSTNANGPGLRFTRSGTANGYVGSAKYIVGGALADFGIDVSGANNLIFGTNDVERARITSGGDLLVGTTNTAQIAGAGIKLNISTASPEINVVGSASTDGTGTSYHLYSTGAAAYRFYVGYGGTVFATSTTISAISDQRLKENVQDLDVGLDKIMALKPRKFDWKAGKGKDIKGDRGFIAQEFEQVFPDLIDEWKDPAPEGEEPYKSVRQDLIPVLVKAIQELKAQNDDLRARVAQLENLKGN